MAHRRRPESVLQSACELCQLADTHRRRLFTAALVRRYLENLFCLIRNGADRPEAVREHQELLDERLLRLRGTLHTLLENIVKV